METKKSQQRFSEEFKTKAVRQVKVAEAMAQELRNAQTNR